MSWLTGNLVIDITAIAGVAFYGAILLGFPLWMLRDKLRRGHGEHFRPIGEPAPAVSEPAPTAVKSGRSPFAPRREAK